MRQDEEIAALREENARLRAELAATRDTVARIQVRLAEVETRKTPSPAFVRPDRPVVAPVVIRPVIGCPLMP